MTPKISVIVPVYKAETFLHQCIDSILAQTFQNFEVLLINDGSPDRSGEICDEYAKKDSRIRVFHKENGGVTSARKYGIEQSCGEWIMFIDSDDYIELKSLELLLSSAYENDTESPYGSCREESKLCAEIRAYVSKKYKR